MVRNLQEPNTTECTRPYFVDYRHPTPSLSHSIHFISDMKLCCLNWMNARHVIIIIKVLGSHSVALQMPKTPKVSSKRDVEFTKRKTTAVSNDSSA